MSPNPAPTEGLRVNQSATFYFQITGITLAQTTQIGAGIHGISGPTGCSTKLGVLPDGSGGGTVNYSGAPTGCGTSVVPEPATFVLLATGLLGVGGAVHLRRRKEGEVETQA